MTGKKTVIALGFFDGVHLGHAELLKRTCTLAAELGVSPAVLTFDVHPDNLIRGIKVPLINDAEGREDIIRRFFGIDNFIPIHFDGDTMHTHWQDFILSLVQKGNAIHFVIGHDFRCGYKGQGSPDKIVEFCKTLCVGCDVIPVNKIDDITVSSSYIRTLISNGDMRRAMMFLGHPHVLIDTVREGCKIGRKLGAPTINMQFPEGVIVPRYGVYATKAYFNDKDYNAVTSIGVKPTVGDFEHPNVETYIFDFDGQLYGCPIRLEFYEFLRDEEKFDSLEELKEQIQKDCDNAKSYFNNL